MEYNHAKELLNTTFCNLILFNGEPVWLKDITDSETAKVSTATFGEPDRMVPLNQLIDI